ncbi:DUF3267 domain-containing protein [Carboxylicivirga sp. RSCT41]|uniref:DUF3267 domain-containing protein n=1 Tax=Carboxylicivirga agarovorans TaxID=3417570 RepID=UPI003D3531C5
MQQLDNYTKEKLTIDLTQANLIGILILIPIVVLFGVPFYFIWTPTIDIKAFMEAVSPWTLGLGLIRLLAWLVFGIIAHEFIHGLTWAIFATKGFKSIRFGVLWNMLTPYCHCKEPLTVRQYITGAITPAIFLGFLPCLYALFTGDTGVLIFGMFFTMAACGDFMIIHLIRKENGSDLVQDHPSEAGCYIYRKTK